MHSSRKRNIKSNKYQELNFYFKNIWNSCKLVLRWALGRHDIALTTPVLPRLLPLWTVGFSHCLEWWPRATSPPLSPRRARCPNIPNTYSIECPKAQQILGIWKPKLLRILVQLTQQCHPEGEDCIQPSQSPQPIFPVSPPSSIC